MGTDDLQELPAKEQTDIPGLLIAPGILVAVSALIHLDLDPHHDPEQFPLSHLLMRAVGAGTNRRAPTRGCGQKEAKNEALSEEQLRHMEGGPPRSLALAIPSICRSRLMSFSKLLSWSTIYRAARGVRHRRGSICRSLS